MIKVAVLTMSDKGSRGEREDESGRLICNMVKDISGDVVLHEIIPDEPKIIEDRLRHFADDLRVDLIVTTGGTGVSPRDVTPEATKNVIEKEIPGLAEFMRAEGCKKTPRAAISRGIVGIRRGSLIVNLPGSPRGVSEGLGVILSTIPHVIEKMHGDESDCGKPAEKAAGGR
ncbi:MAG: MogA/MoaB family molybdenum cofactor biosynthesis protein [Nitrospirae bacterium]|nr:MogA/MoaB family molybdenum cofactor biosynthesis protein [Nitrospirota bacterium]